MIILIFLAIFKLLFLAFPEVVLAASRAGLLLWFNNVMPALLPFIIITNLLMNLGFAELLGKFLAPFMHKIFNLPGKCSIALIAGLTSGYPIGAKTVHELRKNSSISKQNAQHLLAFCNNAGPLFILGVVGIGFFDSKPIGYLLWVGHIMAALVIGILLKNKKKSDYQEINISIIVTNGFSKALGSSIKNAMESMAVIGGVIIFFNTILAIFGEIGFPDKGLFAGLLAGLIEITGGLNKIAESGTNVTSLAIAAFVIAFGGFSIHMQTFMFTEGAGIKAMPYLLAKFLHGIIAAIFTILLSIFFI